MIPTTATGAEMNLYVSRIVTAWQAATPGQLARGQAWYPAAQEVAAGIGAGDTRLGAGVLAALSAQKSWADNVRLAADACGGNVHGHTAETLAKVRAILAGADPASVLPAALKTGHFYRCIVNPGDPEAVVIDRHAHDAAAGERYGNRDRGLSNKNRYATLVTAYLLAARSLRQIASVVQATAWGWQMDLNAAP
jgi:hypothetical protein